MSAAKLILLPLSPHNNVVRWGEMKLLNALNFYLNSNCFWEEGAPYFALVEKRYVEPCSQGVLPPHRDHVDKICYFYIPNKLTVNYDEHETL